LKSLQHADNGRFKDKRFSKSIEDKGQTISFFGVGAYHQNGIAKKRIGDL
jgi:transposase InsO family protein